MPARVRLAAAIAALGLAVAGCGQTDFATDVTNTGATLHATITTVSQEAPNTAWLQY